MNKLYILYDAQDSFCLRCRGWMAEEPSLAPLEFVPYQAPELMAKFEGIEAYQAKNRLLAVGEDGAVYAGPQALVMCLFALENYRDWAARLAAPALLFFAAGAVDLFAAHHGKIPRWLGELGDAQLAELLGHHQAGLVSSFPAASTAARE